MAYTAALRDHVWVIVSDGTPGGFTQGTGDSAQVERWRTIRWIPAAAADTITISRIAADGTQEVIWESTAGGSTAPQESRLDVRFTRGFNITMSTGGKCYMYQMVDGPTAR
jgi:hypothetical protein